jgi:antitoxin component YwqK of YwqJK toxin-antitoxin module
MLNFMNQYYKYLIILILGNSCSRNHSITYINDSGQKFEYEYKIEEGDTILNGLYKEYYKNGNLRVSENNKDGALNGKAEYFWKNGKLRSVLNYFSNRILEQTYIGDTSGNVLDSFTVKNGKGEYREYNSKGILISKYAIDSGLYHGKCLDFDENGELSKSTSYFYGVLNGPSLKIIDNYKEYSTFKEGRQEGEVLILDTLNDPFLKGKVLHGIFIDTCWFYKNKLVDKIVIFKSTNYTDIDSLALGLKKGNSLMSLVQPFLFTKGIIIKEIRYDRNGKQVKTLWYEDNLPVEK